MLPAAAVAALAASSALLTLPAPIVESSGAASSSVSDDWLFTHQDSGSDSDVHAVGLDGRLLATLRLGVQARDWEDMARGPDESGRSSLFLADIGDNNAARDHGILVHRIPEPRLDAGAEGVVVETPPTASFRLRYEDGPRDAETLLVHPTTGRLFVVSKGLGTARLYRAPHPLQPEAPNLLEHVADVRPDRTGTPGGPGIGSLANVLVTAGDISSDGGRLALRTYTDLYEWRVRDGDLAAAVDRSPVVTELPPTVQGEGLAYTRNGTALLTTTEGERGPVHRVPSALPALTHDDGGRSPGRLPIAGTVAAAVAAAALAGAVALRRRAGSGQRSSARSR